MATIKTISKNAEIEKEVAKLIADGDIMNRFKFTVLMATVAGMIGLVVYVVDFVSRLGM